MTENSLLQNPVLQPTSSFVEHRVPRDGSKLYLRDYPGAGPAFVLMHGFPDNLRIYDRLIPILVDAGRHVVAFDFLGFGASDKPAGYNYSFEQQLGDLEAVVEFLKLSQIVPVGHDAGGIAAIDYVLSNPQRVSKLCLLNTFYGDTPTLRLPELVELFAVPDLRALAIAIATDPKQMAFLLTFQQSRFKIDATQVQIDTVDSVLAPLINDNFAQQPSAGPAFAALAISVRAQIQLNNNHLPQLKELTFPSTIIWGKGDAYLDTGVAEDLAAHIKGASLHVLDAGHWPQLDLPEEVGRYLLTDL
jgi:haloalkane dehalogenase